MKIKEKIRANVSMTAHPKGMQKHFQIQNEIAKNLPKFTSPKNVLIIGGSSGYGLASRLVLANNGAHTISISFEREPNGKKMGSAGFWSDHYFDEKFPNHKTFNVDAFSAETKQMISDYLKETNTKIDLLIYSLAAGVRPKGDQLIKSTLKPIERPYIGKTVDIATNTFKDLTVDVATEEEIANTVYVMGGSDWSKWVDVLKENQLLNPGFKTLTYTYVGGKTTYDIYRGGTIGKAKDDLELTARTLKDNGIEAYVVSAKAITTKASVFIPSMIVYGACLYEVMQKHGVHEDVVTHIHRLFQDMIYGSKIIFDEKQRVRVDNYEMDPKIQAETIKMMQEINEEQLLNSKGYQQFVKEFYQLNGFKFDEIDYEEEIDFNILLNK